MSIMSRSFSVLAVAAAMLLPSAASAQTTPPTPEEVVQRHAMAVGHVASRASQAIGTAAQMTVNFVNDLDKQGAPDGAILYAGRRGVERVHAISQRALSDIRGYTETALRILRRLGAGEVYVQQVRDAAHAAAATVRQGAESAVMQIHAAVEAAIGDGKG